MDKARHSTRFLRFALKLGALCLLTLSIVMSGAASLYADPLPPSGWSYQFTSYTWLTSLHGNQTVKGRTVDIDASFIDLVEHAQFPKDLFAMGGYFEARNGPASLFSDIFYSQVGIGARGVQSRGTDSLGGTVGESLGVKFKMVTAELAAAYEVARWGGTNAGTYTAIDIYGGTRIWWQQLDVSLSVTGTANIGDLTINGGRAVARSGDVSWVDPLVGARLRYQIAPGKELMLVADIGGFSAGSKISWQLAALYNWDFLVQKDVVWSGLVGYKALYVDYAQGSGTNRYEFDMLQYGPVLGLTVKF